MRGFATLCLLLSASPALAAEAGGSEMIGPGLKALGALALVLGLILLLYALSRKGFGFMPSAKGGAIEVVEMRSLGPKKAICLVKVRGEELLLGLGADRVDFLSRVGGASFEESLQQSIEEKKL